jgi:hypothetical protein
LLTYARKLRRCVSCLKILAWFKVTRDKKSFRRL